MILPLTATMPAMGTMGLYATEFRSQPCVADGRLTENLAVHFAPAIVVTHAGGGGFSTLSDPGQWAETGLPGVSVGRVFGHLGP